jgi:hypothetical protein
MLSGQRFASGSGRRFRARDLQGSASPTGCNTRGCCSRLTRTPRTPAVGAVRVIHAGQMLNRTVGTLLRAQSCARFRGAHLPVLDALLSVHDLRGGNGEVGRQFDLCESVGRLAYLGCPPPRL